MKYNSSQIYSISWIEWNTLMAKELNETVYKQKERDSAGQIKFKPYKTYDKKSPFIELNEPKTFILGMVCGVDEVNYLKSLGLLNNGRCPRCGEPIIGNPGRFTSSKL